jgi:hypothetical protein
MALWFHFIDVTEGAGVSRSYFPAWKREGSDFNQFLTINRQAGGREKYSSANKRMVPKK